MILSKLHREFIRLWLQAVCGFPCIFPQKFRSKVKMSWNCLQLEEGRLLSRTVRFPETHGAAHVLDLACTSGFGEAVHPDVLYVPQGFGAGGWKWLMTCTPFPGGIVYFENPEFLVSEDGTSWSIPKGQPSPLVSPPSDWIGYNSDPSLLYDGGRIYLFYREVRSENNRYDRVRVFALGTDDGLSWKEPITLFDKIVAKEHGAIVLSPTFLKIGSTYFVWYVESNGDDMVVKRCVGENIENIYNASPCLTQISGMASCDTPWHIDVAEAGDGTLMMALCVRGRDNARRHSILFARSHDTGMTWSVFGDRVDPDDALNERSLYRASIAMVSNRKWKLYYSYQDAGGHWFPLARDMSL